MEADASRGSLPDESVVSCMVHGRWLPRFCSCSSGLIAASSLVKTTIEESTTVMGFGHVRRKYLTGTSTGTSITLRISVIPPRTNQSSSTLSPVTQAANARRIVATPK